MAARQFIESRQEMEAVLHDQAVGYLGLCMQGKPYVVPLNYAYVEGKILFHCALAGKKLDYLRANPDVCFTVGRQGREVSRHGEGDPCKVETESVICYGTARLLEDPEERQVALNAFNRSFRSDADEVSLEDATKCAVVEVQVSEMTGRRDRAHQRTYWRYAF